MWYYFYSHSVCWYKVLHLSQTSFAWVVKVKADLSLHCGSNDCPISRMISQANINRPTPVSLWQLHHCTGLSPSRGLLNQTQADGSPAKIPRWKRWISQASFQKSQKAISHGGQIFVLTFFHHFPMFVLNIWAVVFRLPFWKRGWKCVCFCRECIWPWM